MVLCTVNLYRVDRSSLRSGKLDACGYMISMSPGKDRVGHLRPGAGCHEHQSRKVGRSNFQRPLSRIPQWLDTLDFVTAIAAAHSQLSFGIFSPDINFPLFRQGHGVFFARRHLHTRNVLEVLHASRHIARGFVPQAQLAKAIGSPGVHRARSCDTQGVTFGGRHGHDVLAVQALEHPHRYWMMLSIGSGPQPSHFVPSKRVQMSLFGDHECVMRCRSDGYRRVVSSDRIGRKELHTLRSRFVTGWRMMMMMVVASASASSSSTATRMMRLSKRNNFTTVQKIGLVFGMMLWQWFVIVIRRKEMIKRRSSGTKLRGMFFFVVWWWYYRTTTTRLLWYDVRGWTTSLQVVSL